MVSKNGTFKAENSRLVDYRIVVWLTNNRIGTVLEGELYINGERLSPEKLRELADFLETLNEKTE